jgi:hypothetical protein
VYLKIYAQLNRGYVITASLLEQNFDFDPTDGASRPITSATKQNGGLALGIPATQDNFEVVPKTRE